MTYKKIFLSVIWAYLACTAQPQETQKVFLTGHGKDDGVTWDFYCTKGMNSGRWTTIEVPSCWELKGFGWYNYGNDLYDTLKHIHDEQGIYRRAFEVPADWKGLQVEIVFDGVMTDTEVKINGKLAGPVHQGAFYRFRYDISRLLNYGTKNTIEVRVSKQSANQSVTLAERRADYWIFGGIFRPVWLEAKPRTNIDRIAIDARADGVFSVEIFTKYGDVYADLLTTTITDLEGRELARFNTTISNQKNTKHLIVGTVTGIKPWSPEYPQLYYANVQLLKDGHPVHSLRQRFGFRTVELRKGDGIYLNGTRVMFKGVCRHSFYPTSGRTSSYQLSLQDVLLMKEMNMNAVRMSHYPPDEHFLDVCDSLGLMVLDELAGWQRPWYDTEVGSKLVREMVVRDVNHPCIVLWDNGNEGGSNPELTDDFALWDPQKRPVIHPWSNINGMNTHHYISYNYGVNTMFQGNDIFFPTEFLHGLFDGGHGAGLEDYWTLMESNPLSAGGFLWVFSDEAVMRTDRDGILDAAGSQAPDGIVGPYREKEGSFFTIKQIWSPVTIGPFTLTPAFNGQLRINNKYLFTNLKEVKFDLSLWNIPAFSLDTMERTYSTSLSGPDITPGNTGWLDLKLPDDWKAADVVRLSATDPHGMKIAEWSWPISTPSQVNQRILPDLDKSPRVSITDSLLTVDMGVRSYSFSLSNGLLQRVVSGGSVIPLSNGPVLQNARNKVSSVQHYATDTAYIVEAAWEGEHPYHFTWAIGRDGSLELLYDYRQPGNWDFMGISFDYPENQVVAADLLANGPYRVWKNRLQGPKFGLYHKPYNNTVTGESWDYPEFKGYYDNFYALRLYSQTDTFTVQALSPGLKLHLFTPDPPKAAYNKNTDPPFPSGNLSFLHAISPIGTKFKKPEYIGPSGALNMYWVNEDCESLRGHLIFNF